MTKKRSMLSFKHHWAIALASLILLTLACGLPSALQSLAPEDEPTLPPTLVPTQTPIPQPLPPALVEADPPPGSRLPLNVSITLYFNQAMERAAVENALTIQFSDSEGQIQTTSANLSWRDDATLELVPETSWQQAANYILEISTSAGAANGLTLIDPVSINYATAPPLEVVQMLPEPGVTEVDPSSAVVVTFNQPVVPLGADPGTLPEALIIDPPVTGMGEWVNTSTYIFYPETALFGGATYSISVNPNLSSTYGVALASSTSWSFSTSSPRLVSIEPGDGSFDANLDQSFTLTFNQPMDTISVEGHFTMHDANGEYIPGNFEWEQDDKVVVFTPSELLTRKTEYLLQIPFGAQASGGTPLGVSYEAAVYTVPGLIFISADPNRGELTSIYEGVTLYFSAPLSSDDDLLEYISINPEVPDLYYWLGNGDQSLNIRGSYDAQTEYAITLREDMPDPWGGTLSFSSDYSFQTEALDTRLNFAHYGSYLFITPQDNSLAAQATNISGVDMVLGEVAFEDFVSFLGSGGYDLLNDYQPRNLQIWNQSLDLPGDRMYKTQLLVQPDETGLTPGLYHLSLSAPGVDYPPGPAVLVSSNINLTFKISATQVFVWAIDLRDNQPVPNAPISVYRSDGTQLVSGITDENGIFQSAIPAQEDVYGTFYAILGQPGDDNFSLSLDNWNEGINSYNFGFNSNFTGPETEAYAYTDRPIYRPGQTVSFRVIVREQYNGRYTPVNLQSLPIKVLNQNGAILLENDYTLSSFGTVHGQYTIPEDAQPGTYEIGAKYGGVLFDVAEYRKPEINLQVAEIDDTLADLIIQAQVEARYFFDAPVDDLTLTWNVFKEDDYFYLPGYRVGEESFGWMYPYWMRAYFGYYGEHVVSGEGQTSSEGVLSIELEIPPEEEIQTYTLEVTMTDESGFPVSARTEFTVHPSEYYIGIRPDTWLGQAENQITFDVLTVDWGRNAAPNRNLSAIFQKVTWVREDPDDPYMPPEMVPQYTAVSSADFHTGDDGLARLAFTPPEAGTYQLEIQGADGAKSQLLLWVGGQGRAVWPNLPNQRLRVSADKDSYATGETAQIFIPNPLGVGTQALVTVERGLVSRHFQFTLDESGYTLPLPLTEDDAPNVYVSVSLIGVGAENTPDFRQGYLNLLVDPAAQELNVEVMAVHESVNVSCDNGINCPEHLEPRQDITFDLKVTDANGNPVQGEFSLAVADLAALALADPNSLDIMPAFYGKQPLGVNTSMALTMHVQRQLFVPGGMGGGGGDVIVPFVREDFPDTAYWNAEIVTDANGEAQAAFTLPDSLTTWHVDIRGLTMDTRVGQTETHVVTSRNLLVRPVTPRFAVVGDHVRISAIVHNNSDTDLRVDVALQSAGFVLDDLTAELQEFSIAAGGRQQVIWWGTVEDADTDVVTMIFSASGENAQGDLLYQDITKPVWGDIPVMRYLAPQTFGTAGVINDGGQRLELVSLPRTYDPSSGDLEVELAPSLAAAMTAGLDVLEHYPYECTEQTVSRFLPNLETYRAIQTLGLDAPDLQARLERTLDEGLDRLVADQNEDGGWGWWPSGDSNELVTAYVLFGLSRAKDAGAFVDDAVIQNASNYLLTVTSTLWEDLATWRLDRNAFIQYVLVQAGNGGLDRVASDANELYLHRDRLSSWGQAMLAMTIDGINSGDERVATLFSDLNSTAVRSATGTHWEGSDTWRNMETAIFNSAVVIYALAQDDPASATLPEAVRYLMAQRDARGAWASTYDTAWTLMALTEVMSGTGELAGDFSYSADINGSQLAQGQAGGDTRLNAVTSSLPMQHLFADHPNALTIQRDAGPGRLYYNTHLNVLRPVEDVATLDAGMSVERTYTLLSDALEDQEIENIRAASAGESLKVHLTLTLESEAFYLVVEDYIPAGAEILNANLKTSQQFGEYEVSDPFGDGWGWWYFNDPLIYDDHIAWVVDYLPAGTYELTYTLVLNQPGEYRVIPAQAWQFYFPEVQGNSAGMIFEITK
ncbi:MAG: Ig-like domain-containing protein [Anaerolineales bacterium]|nr:Ig-like domain-containing protein [Chloroflexota bacterium]MBL6979667.1 Ig-like domain-containing protein [Anaerolineales bacterium]